jgi:hypothetical protein
MRDINYVGQVLSVASLLTFLFFYQPPYAAAQAEQVRTIKVKSVWEGLGPRSESKLTIRRRKDGFYRDGVRLDGVPVEDLLREVRFDAGAPTLQNLGITEQWLRDTAEGALPDRLKKAEQNEKDLFLNSYRDVGLIEKLLPQITRGGWTDDYPSFSLRIMKADGSEVVVASDRQNVFMIPFAVAEAGELRYSFNANLGRAAAALLPGDFTNRERLHGDRLQHVIAEAVMREIEEELNRPETSNKLGPELQALGGRYSLKKTSIGYLSSVDVEPMGEKYPRWNAELYRGDLPHNVFIGVSLPFEKKRLKNFDLFLTGIDAMVDHTLSVPWLSAYLKGHPDTSIEVRFVTDRSLSPKAAEYLLGTLKEFGAETLAAEVQGQLDRSVFLEVRQEGGWSRWLILSDRRAILFDFQGDAALNWKVEELTTRTRYDVKYWHMAKAVIAPNGDVLSR